MDKIILISLTLGCFCLMSCKQNSTQESNYLDAETIIIEDNGEDYSSSEDYFSQLDSLNYELNKEIDTKTEILNSLITDTGLLRLIKQERRVYNDFITAQHDFIQSHIDDADMNGTMDYSHASLDNIFMKVHANALDDLINTLNGIPCDFQHTLINIPVSEFQMTFKDIYDYTIPVSLADIGKELPRYSEEKDIINLKTLEQKYMEFISLGEQISRLLKGPQRTAYLNFIYSFQKHFMLQLKNEYQGLGLFGHETAEKLLDEDCTYQELLTTPIRSRR